MKTIKSGGKMSLPPIVRAKPIFVAGQPRSGNTWLLRLLSDFLLAPIVNLPPDENVDKRWCRGCTSDMVVVKSHWRVDQWNDEAIVLIHRDPRDIVISRIFVRTNEPTPAIISKVINELGPENHGGYEKYVEDWLEQDVPIVKYEDLHADGPAALAQLSYELVHHMPNRQECEATFERVSFEKCKAEDPHFTRKGIVGDWKNYFNRENGRQITELLGPLMWKLNYIQSEDWWKNLPT
jgi:hypothetical protein